VLVEADDDEVVVSLVLVLVVWLADVDVSVGCGPVGVAGRVVAVAAVSPAVDEVAAPSTRLPDPSAEEGPPPTDTPVTTVPSGRAPPPAWATA
jgi:hypothetical protein